MTVKNRADLKDQLESGDTFDANAAADLIDSALNLSDTTTQSMSSDLQAPRFIATTEVSAAGHTFAASAVTLNVPTTGAGAAAGSASTFFQMTINGSPYHIPAITSV